MKWDGLVRTSCPPMYMHYCPKCGHREFLFSVEVESEVAEEETKEQTQHDWKTLRNKAAIYAMQGIIGNQNMMNIAANVPDKTISVQTVVAKNAIAFADALINELKGE